MDAGSQHGFSMPWYASPRFCTGIAVVLALIGLGAVWHGVFRANNDFEWHREIGKDFLEGDPYQTTGFHYLPARIFMNAATAELPYRVDRTIHMVLALAALAGTLSIWLRLTGSNQTVDTSAQSHSKVNFQLALCALTLGGLLFYLARDLSDC